MNKRLEVLQKWKGKFGFEATYKKLLEVLLKLSMADVAAKVCHLLRGTDMQKYIQHSSSLNKKKSHTMAINALCVCVCV